MSNESPLSVDGTSHPVQRLRQAFTLKAVVVIGLALLTEMSRRTFGAWHQFSPLGLYAFYTAIGSMVVLGCITMWILPFRAVKAEGSAHSRQKFAIIVALVAALGLQFFSLPLETFEWVYQWNLPAFAFLSGIVATAIVAPRFSWRSVLLVFTPHFLLMVVTALTLITVQWT